jgi:hypothetical protein
MSDVDDEVVLFSRDDKDLQDPAKAIIFTIQHMLKWYAPNPIAGEFLFRSSSEMLQVWQLQGGTAAEFPKVDFTKFMVVGKFLDAGEYSVVPSLHRVAVTKGTINIDFKMVEGFMLMINPAVAIAIPTAEGEPKFKTL